MDHLKILKRSWDIMWRYRALWFFGIIIAIATAGGTSGGGGNTGFQFSPKNNGTSMQPFQFDPGTANSFEEGFREFGRIFSEGIPNAVGTTLAVIIIGFICVMVLLAIVFAILRYISQTALIRMVDEYEETEERRTIGQGFRLGWSRASWRIFLINLVIDIPTAIVFLLLFAISGSPLLLWFTRNNVAGILGTVAAVGLFFLVILVVILVSTSLRVLKQFFYRTCALENLGVFEAISAGYRIVRQNLKDTALMWLILLGIRIAYTIGTLIIGFILLFPALLFGGGIGLLFGGLGALFGEGALPWILGFVTGLPIFILVFVLPLTFLSGLKEVYINNAWTLAYREMKPLVEADLLPEERFEDKSLDEGVAQEEEDVQEEEEQGQTDVSSEEETGD
jgi:hypothetical protein